jgi:hypothetical protein
VWGEEPIVGVVAMMPPTAEEPRIRPRLHSLRPGGEGEARSAALRLSGWARKAVGGGSRAMLQAWETPNSTAGSSGSWSRGW